MSLARVELATYNIVSLQVCPLSYCDARNQRYVDLFLELFPQYRNVEKG